MVQRTMPRLAFIFGLLLLFCCSIFPLFYYFYALGDAIRSSQQASGISKDFQFKIPRVRSNYRYKFIILVLSSVGNFVRRDAIRASWGQDVLAAGGRMWFVVGYQGSPLLADEFSENDRAECPLKKTAGGATCNELVTDESRANKDILTVGVEEHYANLVFKLQEAFGLANLREAPYLLKTDDDVYVNIPQLADFVSELDQNGRSSNFYGYKMSSQSVIRNETSKWFIPEAAYQSNTLPNYLSGTGYLMPTGVLSALTLCSELPGISMVPAEDVYFTGLCRQHHLFNLVHDDRFGFQDRLRTGYLMPTGVLSALTLCSELPGISMVPAEDVYFTGLCRQHHLFNLVHDDRFGFQDRLRTGYLMPTGVLSALTLCSELPGISMVPAEDVYFTGLCRQHHLFNLVHDDRFGFQDRLRTGYLMPTGVLSALTLCSELPGISMVPAEDVYFTGLCRQHHLFNLVHDDRFGFQDRLRVPCLLAKLIIIHGITPTEMENIYTELHSDIQC